MKEYLKPRIDGTYELVTGTHAADSWIEVPDGAERARNYNGELKFYSGQYMVEDVDIGGDHFGAVVWQRHTQPEELPFVDDEPKTTAWNKQEGGSHYKSMAIQPMEFALKNGLDYAQGNVIKYVCRHAAKNGKEDLLKAIHNIELMIEHYYPDSEPCPNPYDCEHKCHNCVEYVK